MAELPELPLRDEIATLRARVQRGTKAQVHVMRLQAVQRAVATVAVQAAARPDVAWEVPGAELVDEVRAEWGLPPDDPDGDPIWSRQVVLKRLEAAVQPHLAGAGAAQSRLMELIEEQKRILAEPTYHDVVHELKHLAEAWTHKSSELEPLQQHVAMLGPAVDGVSDALDRLDAALLDDDPRELVRAVRIGGGLVRTLEGVLGAKGLDADLPEVPEGEDAAAAEALREVLEQVGRKLHALQQEREEAAEACAADVVRLQARVFAITG